MGHYCYFCDVKISEGYRPTCCFGYESTCKKCMQCLLDGTCTNDLKNYLKTSYNIVGGNIVIPCRKDVLDWLTCVVQCPKCSKEINEDSFEDY